MRAPGQDKKSRNARDVGRQKILDAARALFRANIKHEVSRQDIARHAGVAPALMTYYFQSNWDLVFAVTRPILAQEISDLTKVIDSSASCEERLRRVIESFIDFAHHNAPLLDIFVAASIESGDQDAQLLIGSILDKLGQFFNQAVEVGVVAKETNPRFLLLALWGMCRLVGGAQPYPLPIIDPEMQIDNLQQLQADLILKLVMHGAGTGHPE